MLPTKHALSPGTVPGETLPLSCGSDVELAGCLTPVLLEGRHTKLSFIAPAGEENGDAAETYNTHLLDVPGADLLEQI